jgi:phosphate transport system substrate-binding protein
LAIKLKKQLKMSAAGIALASAFLAPSALLAQDVTLVSTDGTINVSGQFVSFENDTYVLRTALGDLRIASSSVICQGAACPTFDTVSADVVITGSEAIAIGMMPLLMTGFAANLDADAEITNTSATETIATLIDDGGFGDEIGSYLISSTSSEDAFQALLDGEAMIGMSSRRITQDEARALRADGSGSMVSPEQERIIAVDSMVVVTHSSNPVQELTAEQLAGIFSGQIRNWSEVGGTDRPINIISYEPGSANYEYFMSYVFGEDRPNVPVSGIAADDQAMSNVMFHDVNGIGYLGFAFQRGAQPVKLVNECGIATQPDAFSAKTEEYELSRRMYLYNRADTIDAGGQAFLDYVMSDEADSVIGKSGFIDLGVVRRAQGENDPRRVALIDEIARYDIGFEGEIMNEMLERMGEYDRLSTTFRFRTGSSNLDERGRLDLERLINYLEEQPAGTKIAVVGFTDDVGPFEANRVLAVERAGEVLREIRAVGGDRIAGIELETFGFGEVAPSACNISERGRGINRRVEIWISNSTES